MFDRNAFLRHNPELRELRDATSPSNAAANAVVLGAILHELRREVANASHHLGNRLEANSADLAEHFRRSGGTIIRRTIALLQCWFAPTRGAAGEKPLFDLDRTYSSEIGRSAEWPNHWLVTLPTVATLIAVTSVMYSDKIGEQLGLDPNQSDYLMYASLITSLVMAIVSAQNIKIKWKIAKIRRAVEKLLVNKEAAQARVEFFEKAYELQDMVTLLEQVLSKCNGEVYSVVKAKDKNGAWISSYTATLGQVQSEISRISTEMIGMVENISDGKVDKLRLQA